MQEADVTPPPPETAELVGIQPIFHAPPVPTAQPGGQQFILVQVPPGAVSGMPVNIATPNGTMQVIVPPGLSAGMQFQVALPAAPQPVMVSEATPMGVVLDEPAAPAPEPAPTVSTPKFIQVGLDSIFRFFAQADTDKSGALDQSELSRAIESNDAFRKQLAEAADVPYETDIPTLVAKVIGMVDMNGNGQLEAAELERLLRGWRHEMHETRDDMTKANEDRRLAGAKENAERRKNDHGGFAGLTDASEALAIGEAAQGFTEAEKAAFGNDGSTTVASHVDSTAFETRSDMTRANEDRRLAGAKERAEIRKNDAGGFAGLTDASEALAIGEAAQGFTEAEKKAFAESNPAAFPGGAHYVTDASAAAERAEADAIIRKQEEEEYLYKERFKGLDADEALKVRCSHTASSHLLLRLWPHRLHACCCVCVRAYPCVCLRICCRFCAHSPHRGVRALLMVCGPYRWERVCSWAGRLLMTARRRRQRSACRRDWPRALAKRARRPRIRSKRESMRNHLHEEIAIVPSEAQ